MGFKVLFSIFYYLPMTSFLEHWSCLLKKVKSELLHNLMLINQSIYLLIAIALKYLFTYSG